MELRQAAQSVYRTATVARPSILTVQPETYQAAALRPLSLRYRRQFSTAQPWRAPPPPRSFPEPTQSPSSVPASRSPTAETATRNTPPASQVSQFPVSPRERLRNSLGQRGAPSSSPSGGGANLPPRPSFLKNFGPGSEQQSRPKAPWNRAQTATGESGTGTGANANSSSSSKRAEDSLSIAAMVNDTVDGVLQTWDEREFLKSFAKPQEELRLVPSTGRTVRVSGNVDVARSFFLLDRAVRQNKVKHDVSLQRFHERPGLKRKRLRRERWRKRFITGFRATCKRVQELRAQGW